MTKSNKETKVRSRKAKAEKAEATTAVPAKPKKVLTDKDITIGGKAIPTDKELKAQTERELRKESADTGAPRAASLEPRRQVSGLARGLDGRNAPHSKAALRAERAAAKGTNKADKRAEREKAKAERKAARAARAAPKADDTRRITILDKNFTFGREGTARNLSWLACKKAKTVADYAKAGGKLKYLPRWAAAGAIKLG